MILGWFKGTFFLVLSFGNWEDPPPHVGKNCQIIPYFFFWRLPLLEYCGYRNGMGVGARGGWGRFAQRTNYCTFCFWIPLSTDSILRLSFRGLCTNTIFEHLLNRIWTWLEFWMQFPFHLPGHHLEWLYHCWWGSPALVCHTDGWIWPADSQRKWWHFSLGLLSSVLPDIPCLARSRFDI